VHIHAHYPNQVQEILKRTVNAGVDSDFLVTVRAADLEDTVRQQIEQWGLSAPTLLITENRGRNFGPLLTAARLGYFDAYDVVCHLHTKASPHLPQVESALWRDYLLQNLLGGDTVRDMVARLHNEFSAEPHVGLIYPADMISHGFGKNREMMASIGKELGISLGDEQIDFPAGGMFWIRRQALHVIADWLKDLRFEDEPIGRDGALAHAVERLIPYFVEAQGLSTVQTYIPGVLR
jgi:lipopolysaccharide biosynthesis protein